MTVRRLLAQREVQILLAVFAISRWAAYAAGMRFDVSGVNWFWQLLDPALLKERLFESILYLHGQPPAFNLLLGLSLKAFPVHYAAFLHILFALSGVVAMLCLHQLLQDLGTSRKTATMAAGILAI